MIEEILIIFLGFTAGYVFAVFWCKIVVKKIRKGKTYQVRGYHVHHSVLIAPAIVLANLFSGDLSIFFLTAGIGALFHDFLKHKGKLKFITKD